MLARIKNNINRKIDYFFIYIIRRLPSEYAGKIIFHVTDFKFIKNDSSKYRVFAISAAAFQKDLKELQKIKTMELIYCDQRWVSYILWSSFPKGHPYLNHFYGVNDENRNDQKVKEYIKDVEACFGAFVSEILKKYGKIDWFLFPSYNQGGMQIFAQYAKNNNIKTASFHYEHYTTPMAKKFATECYLHYRARSVSDKIFVWHEGARKMLIEIGVAPKDALVVSGPPRFNRWNEELLIKNKDKKLITLLSFPGSDYWAPFTYGDIVLALKDLSLKYKDYIFYIKCKDQFHCDQTTSILYGDFGNLKISWKDDMIDILSSSKIIIGFNSLSFLESFLSRASLILPFWGDSKHDDYLLQVSPNNQEVQKLVNIAHSREHFKILVEDKILSPDEAVDLDARIKFLNEYIYFNQNKKSIDIFEDVFLNAGH